MLTKEIYNYIKSENKNIKKKEKLKKNTKEITIRE